MLLYEQTVDSFDWKVLYLRQFSNWHSCKKYIYFVFECFSKNMKVYLEHFSKYFENYSNNLRIRFPRQVKNIVYFNCITLCYLAVLFDNLSLQVTMLNLKNFVRLVENTNKIQIIMFIYFFQNICLKKP